MATACGQAGVTRSPHIAGGIKVGTGGLTAGGREPAGVPLAGWGRVAVGEDVIRGVIGLGMEGRG